MKLMEEYGIRGILVFIILSIIGSLIKPEVIKSVFLKIFIFFKKTDSKIDVNESNVTNHDIFNYIDFWISSKVSSMEFSTEYRSVAFRKYLRIFLTSYKDGLYGFVSSGKYKSMDQSEFWKEFLTVINTIVSDYERKSYEAGIPEAIISKMRTRNNETVKLTIDLVNNISRSDFYTSDDNYLKLYSILNILLSILENTISSSISICNSINGELKGMSMDGKTEP